ncbi:hypothetical protein SCLCIDRAFT_1221361 [Scleroderma citrinum Foug A]|uniref:Uncharacterized protein n=1 Tax=Scleroderma citrinum Foug A TaxID=1036808 RepID=A0A0C3DGL4_9AGAM|nr:hypothetical protein SCLCIDRAFT_1221361 [Scleroderma citrinum Foug A]
MVDPTVMNTVLENGEKDRSCPEVSGRFQIRCRNAEATRSGRKIPPWTVARP